MRALIARGHGGPEVLELVADYPDPEPGPQDLLVEVHACALNPVDTKVRQGLLGEREAPYVLGFDVSGVVRAVGADVSEFAVGDEVYASPSLVRDGACADLVCVDARLVAKKPARVDHVHAAALPLVTLTAWEALFDRCQLGTDETLLVQAGAGGVGHVAIQLAKQRGARIFTTAGRPESQALCRKVGADVVIDYRKCDFVEAVNEATDGRGCDIIFDTVGGETFDRSLDCVAVNGRVVTIVYNESVCISEKLFRKNATLHYEFMGVPAIHGIGLSGQSEILRRVAELVDLEALSPHVGRVISLEEVAAAHADLEAGTSLGKTVVKLR
jgi:NADPH2:quinone reductase